MDNCKAKTNQRKVMWIDSNTLSVSKLNNRYKSAACYLKKVSVNTAFPVEIVIEITSHCNLSCIMCSRKSSTRTGGYMDFLLFKRIINQVKGYAELVYLSGGIGEPLMHPDLHDMIEYCVRNDVRVGVSTNATLLTAKKTDLILKNPPDILLLSLDGATKETVEKIRVGSKFEKTMENVCYFLKEKHKRGAGKPFTIVQMVYMPENQDEEELFHGKWKAYKGADDVRFKKFVSFYGAERTPGLAMSFNSQDNSSCIIPYRQLSISFDGTIAFCCLDSDFKDPIGNVNSSSISELWNSKKMVEYRKLLAEGLRSQVPTCRECTTIKTSRLTLLGSVLVDDFTIRKILPLIEKIFLKAGIRLIDY